MQDRLQKLIAAAGIASRRHAEELIKAGKVSVNGEVVTELGTKADPETDHIKVNGRLINPLLKPQEKIYVLLNKPKGLFDQLVRSERPAAGYGTGSGMRSAGCIRWDGSTSTPKVCCC